MKLCRRAALTLQFAFLAGLAACGTDTAASAANTDALYCGRVAQYNAVTSHSDAPTMSGLLDGLHTAAKAAHDLADVAPEQTRTAHEVMADAASELAAAADERTYRDVNEMIVSVQQIATELRAQYDNFDGDAATVIATVKGTCGVDLGGS